MEQRGDAKAGPFLRREVLSQGCPTSLAEPCLEQGCGLHASPLLPSFLAPPPS